MPQAMAMKSRFICDFSLFAQTGPRLQAGRTGAF
jgi:hypothetical protein